VKSMLFIYGHKESRRADSNRPSAPATSLLFQGRLQGSVLFPKLSPALYLAGATLGQQGAERELSGFCTFGWMPG
jgi:hypothetical protein